MQSGYRADPVAVHAVHQVVEDLTTSATRGGRSGGAEDRFVRYLRDDATCSIAYSACLEGIRTALAQGADERLLDTVLVLRQYLTPYPPSVSMLITLQAGVADVLVHPGLRSVLHRKAVESLANAIEVHGDTLTGRNAIKWRQRATHRRVPSSCGSPSTRLGHRRGDSADDFPGRAPGRATPTSQQTRSPAAADARRCLRRSVQSCSVFGSRQRPDAIELLPPWRPPQRRVGSSAAIEFAELAAKTAGEIRTRKPATPPAASGPTPAKPDYATAQVHLTQEHLAEVLETLATHMPGGMGPSQKEVDAASKLLVATLCESYAAALNHDFADALRLTTLLALHVIRDLIGSPWICVRRLACDLVFNLAVHVGFVGDTDGAQRGHLEVLSLTHELLILLVQRREHEDLLWERAMVLWLAVATEPGSSMPRREALRDVDLRALRRFLWLPSVVCDEGTRAALVGIVHDALLIRPQGNPTPSAAPRLDSKRLEDAGGWHFIVDVYVSVNSWQARLHCYTLLFEHIAVQLLALSELKTLIPERAGRTDPERQLLDLVCAELIQLDFHWFLPRVFKEFKEHDNRALHTWLETEGPLRDGAARSVLEKVLTNFLGLSHEWNRLPAPVLRDIKRVQGRDVDVAASMQQLTGLAVSDSDSDSSTQGRAIVGRWLLSLMRHCDSSRGSSAVDRLRSHIEGVMHELAAGDEVQTRLVYLDAAEKHLLLLRERERGDGEGHFHEQLERYASQLIKQQESHPIVLLRMFHLVCDLLAAMRTDAPLLQIPPGGGTAAELLLCGVMQLTPGVALKSVCRMFAHILVYLTPGQGPAEHSAFLALPYLLSVRRALLATLSGCAGKDRSVLDHIGGLALWRMGLADSDADICTLSAVFTCGHLQHVERSLWAQALAELHDAGSEAEQTTLSSPLLLARHALRLFDSQRRRSGDLGSLQDGPK